MTLPGESGQTSLREVCDARRGYVHSVETGGTLDGPGIRFVLFLNGCPLRCKYCHNPDTWQIRHGTLRDAEDILAEIGGYAGFLQRAKGGVTISGGEPLMQPLFVETILRGAKALGLHTALDSSGHLHHHAPDSLLEALDLVLLDIKAGDDPTHRRVTGKPLAPTLEFARRLERMGVPVWCRFVLVPGLTDSEENLRNVARIIAGLHNVDRVEILPFHQLASFKYEKLGLPYELKDVRPADPRDVVMAWRVFSEEGVFGTR